MTLPDPRTVQIDLEARLQTNRRLLERVRGTPAQRRDNPLAGHLHHHIRRLEDQLLLARKAEAYGRWPLHAEKSLAAYISQPRAPAGQSDGGQWISAGGGEGKPIREASLARGVFTIGGLLARRILPGVLADNVIQFRERSDAVDYYNRLNEANDDPQTIPYILYERGRVYTGQAGTDAFPYSAGTTTKEDIEQACKYYGTAQNVVDRVDAMIDRNDYSSAQTYGTAFHLAVKDEIVGLGKPDLQAELSVAPWKAPNEAAKYGEPGSTRLDLLETVRQTDGTATLCVYDVKTGKAGLSDRRMDEIQSAVKYYGTNVTRIFVTEIRPSR